MANLSASRWAPASYRVNNDHNSTAYTSRQSHAVPRIPQPQGRNPSTSPSRTSPTPNPTHQPNLTQPQRELLSRHTSHQKFLKLHRRLKWKSRALLFSQHRALDANERQCSVVGSVAAPMETGEAEMMFKIDFFEFYVLLERVLVFLLGSLGLVVTGAVPGYGGGRDGDVAVRGLNGSANGNVQVNTTPNGDDKAHPQNLREQLWAQHGLLGDSRSFHGYAHRFHANVLAALDQPGTPVHEILGTGVVRDYLGIAKEFRNRWKDVEEKPAGEVDTGLEGTRYEKILTDLKLEEMLAAILTALERAGPVLEVELAAFAESVGVGDGLREAMMELDDNDAGANAPWEAMPDAMDWD